MKKEDILEASKKENKKKDPYIIEVQSKGSNLASIAVIILAFFYLIYELHTTSNWNPAIYSIITIYNCIVYGYRALKIEKDRGLFIFNSIVWGILTIVLILEYFKVF